MTRSEEELRVGTAERESGRVRLKKYVVEDEVTQTVPVRREEVRLEREPITDGNVGAATDGPAISEEEHEVVLHEEEPVVEKQAVPKERVRLDKEAHTEERQVSDTVRKEEIEVDDARGARAGRERRPRGAAPVRPAALLVWIRVSDGIRTRDRRDHNPVARSSRGWTDKVARRRLQNRADVSPFVSPRPRSWLCRAKALRNHNPRVGRSSPSSGMRSACKTGAFCEQWTRGIHSACTALGIPGFGGAAWCRAGHN